MLKMTLCLYKHLLLILAHQAFLGLLIIKKERPKNLQVPIANSLLCIYVVYFGSFLLQKVHNQKVLLILPSLLKVQSNYGKDITVVYLSVTILLA